jgi:hypothetical protein
MAMISLTTEKAVVFQYLVAGHLSRFLLVKTVLRTGQFVKNQLKLLKMSFRQQLPYNSWILEA